MKKFFKSALLLSATLLMFSACSDKNEDEPIKPGSALLTSFGFYAEDNAATFVGDYEGIISGNKVSVRIPDGVSKTALIARFTVSAGSIATISGIPQVSRISINDFTNPLDLVITNGLTNRRYTITISSNSLTFDLKATSEADVYSDMVMAINSNTQEPYMAYAYKGAASADRKISVRKLNSDFTWSVLGDVTGFSAGRSTVPAIEFLLDGTPIVSYVDYAATTAQSMSVQMFKNNAWKYVGEQGVSIKVQNPSIAGLSENDIVSVAMNNTSKTDPDYRTMNMSSFNGSWNANAKLPGYPSYAPYYNHMKRVGNTIYWVGFNYITSTDPATSNLSAYKYENGDWTALGNDILGSNATAIYLRCDIAFDVDADGNMYVLSYMNADGGSNYVPTVMKYTASTSVWSVLGNPIASRVATGTEYISMAVSPNGTPYIMYRNNSTDGFPCVSAFNSERRDWDAPIVVGQVKAEDMSLAFDANGRAYAFIFDGNGDNVKVFVAE